MAKRPKTVAPSGSPSETPSTPSKTSVLPIVGIGTSAGGLEALECFLRNTPVQTGLAYVVIQHLDPDFKGMLPELLQRTTGMSVLQAIDGMEIVANCVYVIPPNKDILVEQGVLRVHAPKSPRGLRLPIDVFFQSLALDRREYAVAVVLSGMGNDGTLGVGAIKANGGFVLVQDPSTAKFDVMPRSAIASGFTDFVGAVEDIPKKIISHLQNTHTGIAIHFAEAKHTSPPFETLIQLLKNRTGHDFSNYKRQSIHRRVERRMVLHQLKDLALYTKFLQDNPAEVDLLFKELLIGVTSFFRDPEVWDYLKQIAIPALIAQHPNGNIFRAWIPACSTGEEAYSLAIVFREALNDLRPSSRYDLQIFASDLNEDAVSRARQGLFPATIATDVSPARLAAFFLEEDGGYRVSKQIRESIVFAVHSVLVDAPFTKLDILSCRNLLIYLDAALQEKLFPIFHYALRGNGILVLGSAEAAGLHPNLFETLDSKARVYRRIEGRTVRPVDFPTRQPLDTRQHGSDTRLNLMPNNFQSSAEQYLLQNLSPPAILVNTDGDIVFVNGKTGKYLEPAAGRANMNIYAMAREGLRYELGNALSTAIREKRVVELQNLQVSMGADLIQLVNVTVKLLTHDAELKNLVMIVFHDVSVEDQTPHQSGIDSADSNESGALFQTRKELQAAREEMQSTKEELMTINEELQSTNEELQSTNEELMTSKEEMQSMNEELRAVNAELQVKIDDLSMVNSDMKNLLNSTDIATIFLDANFCIRRFTEKVSAIFKLIPGDVGRPLSDIVNELEYPNLESDAQQVQETLMFIERQVNARHGRVFHVRIMPYRTTHNVIDGVVITFTDITAFKKIEAELRSKIAG